MSHSRRALSLTLTGLTSLGIIACSSTPAATPAIPAIPTVSIPAIPTVSIPAIPTVSIPALPSGLPSGLPSFAIPTFHQAPDLENALPNQIRGVTLMKASYTGELFLSGGSSDQEFQAILTQFGKTPADLAVAGANDPTNALSFQLLVFRLAGVNANQLVAAFLAAGAASGSTQPAISTANVGGKNVTITTEADGTKSYIYTKDELLYTVGSTADDADALVGEILAALP